MAILPAAFLSLLLILQVEGRRNCKYQCINEDYMIEVIHIERSTLGEGPFWDEDKGLLYWVDMRKVALNSYDPVANTHAQAYIANTNELSGPLTLAIPVKDNPDVFLIGMNFALAFVRWDGRSPGTLTPKHFVDIEDPQGSSRTNDGKADPSNRLWVGTMGAQLSSNPNTFEKDKGSMFRVTPDGVVTQFVKNMQISNGLEWSLNARKFFLVDSFTFKLYEYDYDDKKGEIKNEKVIYDFAKEGDVTAMNSLPDGMTIDQNGNLWIALYAMSKVVCINPKTRSKIFEIELPSILQPTSLEWGGRDLDMLFVTSANVDWTSDLEDKYPFSGKLVKISNLGVKGIPSRYVKVDKEFLEGL